MSRRDYYDASQGSMGPGQGSSSRNPMKGSRGGRGGGGREAMPPYVAGGEGMPQYVAAYPPHPQFQIQPPYPQQVWPGYVQTQDGQFQPMPMQGMYAGSYPQNPQMTQPAYPGPAQMDVDDNLSAYGTTDFSTDGGWDMMMPRPFLKERGRGKERERGQGQDVMPPPQSSLSEMGRAYESSKAEMRPKGKGKAREMGPSDDEQSAVLLQRLYDAGVPESLGSEVFSDPLTQETVRFLLDKLKKAEEEQAALQQKVKEMQHRLFIKATGMKKREITPPHNPGELKRIRSRDGSAQK
ncbi:hypothetical protein H0H92_009925, partial [Tricholoma furcatifolium]